MTFSSRRVAEGGCWPYFGVPFMRAGAAYSLLICVLALPLMITGESLWLDEGSTALFAQQPTLSSWWRYIENNTTSDAQMPLYMLCAWAGEKVVGSKEWQLRAVNVVWGAFALFGMAYSGRKLRAPFLPVLLAIQPFIWFYMNEARHYMLHVAAGSWLLASVVTFLQDRGTGWLWGSLFGVGTVILSYGTMLAPVTVGAIVATCGVIAFRARWRVCRTSLIAVAISAVLCLPAGLYYAGTLSRGAKGAELWKVGPTYLPYVVYELTGLSGLGPANPEIREAAKGGNLKDFAREHRFQITLVLLAGLTWLFLALTAVRAIHGRGADQPLIAICGVLLIVFITLTGASFAAEKPFWARHYAATFPFYIAALGLGIKAGLGSSARSVFYPTVVVYLCLTMVSSLSIRFASRHRKEDYRSASAVARQALEEGKSVWWIAAPEPAEYYGVPLVHTGFEEGRAYSPSAKIRLKTPPADIAQLPRPDLIIISRPDAFDSYGIVQGIVKADGYRREGGARHFEFYRR